MFRPVIYYVSVSNCRALSNLYTTTSANATREKDPLVDSFNRRHNYLRISLTERCNLRCKYCMPEEGVQLSPKTHLLTTKEVIYVSELFVKHGVDKIRLTGGEPTVRKDLLDIIGNLKQLPGLNTVAITTNGLMLTRQLVALQRAGLDLINISLDTLKPAKYELITRRKGWERVVAGIDLAIQLGYKPKINCVVMKDFNADEIIDFVEFTRDRNVDVRFIEYMPFSGNKWKTDNMVTYKDMLEVITSRWGDFAPLENLPNDTSKAYAVPEFKGQVGFITSMSEHFCGSCNRLRITADGNLKVCLFGNAEVSLRDAIRAGTSHDDMVALIAATVYRKKRQHAAQFLLNSATNSLSTNYGANSFNLGHLFTNRHPSILNLRAMSTLTHVDGDGKVKMVNVGEKEITHRTAVAIGKVEVGSKVAQLIQQNNIKKGDVLTVSQIAGIMACKRTSEIIPLCHNININYADVKAVLDTKNYVIDIKATVQCTGKTGVEMEALTAVTIAALTVYDMCKAVSHDITISNVKLLEKSGGKSNIQKCDQVPLKYNKDPIKLKETFYPVYV